MKKSPQLCSALGAMLLLAQPWAHGQQSIQRIADINQQDVAPSALTDGMVAAGNQLFISMDDYISGAELWSLDVTNANATPVLRTDIRKGTSDTFPSQLTAGGSYLFFAATDDQDRRNLWRLHTSNYKLEQVADLEYQGTDDGGVQPRGPEQLFFLNGNLYFEGFDNDKGLELWRTSANAATVPNATTALVANINNQDLSDNRNGDIQNLFAFNGKLYFSGNGFLNGNFTGQELWVSDGTAAGTQLVADINPGAGSSSPGNFTIFNGFLYFTAQGPSGLELYRTTGETVAANPNSLELVEDIQPGQGGSSPRGFAVVPGYGTPDVDEVFPRLYFVAQNDELGDELWYTDTGPLLADDTTRSPIALVAGAAGGRVSGITPIQVGNTQQIVFAADRQDGAGKEPYVFTNGVTGGTLTRLVNIAADGPSDPRDSNPTNFFRLGTNLVVFTATTETGDLQLWKTNGTSGGTSLVLNLPEEPNLRPGGTIRNFTVIGAKLYFMLNDDELWETDGTTVGTRLRHEFRSATDGSFAQNYVEMGGNVYFSADDGVNGRELWKTDGTSGGTSMVKDIASGESAPGVKSSSNPRNMVSAGNLIFFTASSANSGDDSELWMSDGTEAGTVRVKDIRTGAAASTPAALFWHNGTLYFSATDGVTVNDHGRELWKSDGTPEGTVMVADLVTGNPSSDPRDFFVYKGEVYFSAASSNNGREIFKTDGTEAGTVRALDIFPGASSSDPVEFRIMKDNLNQDILYFVATGIANINGNNTNVGRELWRSDGTITNTRPVRNIKPGSLSSNPSNLVVIGKTLYFAADDGVNGMELWKTDGTELGTVMVANIAAGISGSDPNNIVNANGRLYFLANNRDANGNEVDGEELWTFSGTSASIVRSRYDADGAGPTAPVEINGIRPGAASPGIQSLVAVNGSVIFSADDGVIGREVWISNGTPGGTRVTRDQIVGLATSSPGPIFAFGTQVIFAASSTQSGNEPRIGNMVPSLQLSRKDTLAAVPQNGTVNFTPGGPVVFPAAATDIEFRMKNFGLTDLTGVSVLISGSSAADYTVFKKPGVSLGADSDAGDADQAADTGYFTIRFVPKEGGNRDAVVTVVSSIGNYAFNVTGQCEKDPTITLQPQSEMLFLGGGTTLTTAAATGTGPFTYQWRRNNGNMAGATGLSLTLTGVKLTDAGAYTVAVKNGLAKAVTGISNPAQIGVVEAFNPAKILALKMGAAATITVNAAGNSLTYRWRKDGGDLPDDARISGQATKTLSIKNLVGTDSAVYTCEVTGPGGMKVGGNTRLSVFTMRPDVIEPQNLPDGVISGFYSHQITVEPGDDKAPSTFTATGLPPGVKVDAKTGLISGRPTKTGKFQVRVNASNAIGAQTPAPAAEEIEIFPFPDGVAGVYTGLVAPSVPLNGGLGGKFDVTITGTGTFTGALFMGATRFPLTGAMDIPLAGAAAAPPYTATVQVRRTGTPTPPPLTFTFTVDASGNIIPSASSSVSDGTNPPAAAEGWEQVWKGTTPQATPYMGYYTFGIRLPTGSPLLGDSDVPQGQGYGSFTVAKDGKLTFAGRSPDGETLSGGTFVGPQGQLAFFSTLYTPARGALHGKLTIDVGPAADVNDTTDNTLGGTLTLVRPANAKSRAYPLGFGLPGTPETSPVPYEAVGGRYVPPALILNIPVAGTTTANAELLFSEGGVDTDIANAGVNVTRNPDANVVVGTNNRITILAPNPAATRLTVAPTTGILGGGFALDDPNPRGIAPTSVKRTATIFGIIYPDNGVHVGGGYFILSALPSGNVSPATTPTTSPNYSGKVVLKTLP